MLRTPHSALRTGRVVAAAVAFSACAHIEPPPGGEEDVTAPELVSVTPDTLSTVPPFRGPVIFEFDERLSEQGADEEAVIVSPRTSGVQVGKSGGELRVSLREGWEGDHIYHVTVGAALQDLWNNRITEPLQLVFSTGPQIPDTRLAGSVVDRITGEPQADVRVEAIRAADSLVYALPTDSAGGFVFARIPEGDYLVRAFSDLDLNRELDPFEARDTAGLVLAAGDTAAVRLSVVQPDSTPPILAAIEYADGVVEVQFDDYLDPAQSVAPPRVRLTGPRGETIALARMSIGILEPRDTTTRDTLAPDTLAADTIVADTVVADTSRMVAAAPRERLPSQTLAVEPGTPLAPETEYRITVEGVRNVVGLVGGGDTTFTTPAAPPPAPSDSASAAGSTYRASAPSSAHPHPRTATSTRKNHVGIQRNFRSARVQERPDRRRRESQLDRLGRRGRTGRGGNGARVHLPG